MNENEQAIQQRLDTMERLILITAGELKIRPMMGKAPDIYTEDKLGELLSGVLELKKLLNVPSNLSVVSTGETQV